MKLKAKKKIKMFAAGVLIFSLAACGGASTEKTDGSNTESAGSISDVAEVSPFSASKVEVSSDVKWIRIQKKLFRIYYI